MKFDMEIEESDMKDREIIHELILIVSRTLGKMSKFGQNTLSKSIDRLINDLEFMENEWLFCQRERMLNILSEKLNVQRSRMGQPEWDE